MRSLGLKNLWFKYEGSNPTGSYKDRFAAAAVTHLKLEGKRACLGTSSGNTGAALAAYCARAGMACYLAIVEGAPLGSGAVESLCRQLQNRFKSCGQFWSRKGLTHLLAINVLFKNQSARFLWD